MVSADGANRNACVELLSMGFDVESSAEGHNATLFPQPGPITLVGREYRTIFYRHREKYWSIPPTLGQLFQSLAYVVRLASDSDDPSAQLL
jgi:hypothetical protein